MPISLTELAGMLSWLSFVQPLKAFLPIAFALFGTMLLLQPVIIVLSCVLIMQLQLSRLS